MDSGSSSLLVRFFTKAFGISSVGPLFPGPPSALLVHPTPFFVASMTDAAISLGSQTRSTIKLSKNASISKRASGFYH